MIGDSCIGHVLCPQGMSVIPGPSQRADFCLDHTEVTVDSYRNCVSSGRCSPPGMNARDEYCNYSHGDRGKHPINCVTAEQAQVYCYGLGKRLPIDYEWEWAATSAGKRALYVWGEQSPDDPDLCWQENRGAHTCEVGSFPKDVSQQGVYDMAGNVREWTVGPEAENSVRGGAWNSSSSRSVRTSSRTSSPGNSSARSIGFRCARDHL